MTGRVALALVAALASTSLPLARADAPAELGATRFELPNGLDVVLQPDAAVSSVVVHTWHRVGYETAPHGLAAVFEQLMFRGSTHVADGAFESLVDAAGGWTNATTASDHTSTITSVPAGALTLALQLEAERMAGLGDALDQRRLDAQRAKLTAPGAPVVSGALRAALWPMRPAEVGHAATLAAVTLAEATAFWRAHYGPDQALLVITGRFDPDATRALVTRLYGWMPRRGSRAPIPSATIAPAASPRTLHVVDDVPTSRVVIGFRTPSPLDAARHPLAIAARILGTGTRARLHERLVATRLATEIRVDLPPDPGGVLTLEVVLAAGVAPATAITAITAELAQLRDHDVAADELARAKTAAEASLVESLENLAFRAETLARWVAGAALPNFLDRARSNIREVTAAHVREVATVWLADRAAVTVIVERPAAARAVDDREGRVPQRAP